ncbi:MAG: Fis family transcriptional regulator [Gammaproteobacteria bacterium]|nr:Fis family transcriptional regulator [Gammaproteobacteria bacterium]
MTAESRMLTRDRDIDMPLPSTPDDSGRLCEHVRLAVDQYLRALDGYVANGLYEMVIQEVERPMLEAVLIYCGHNQSKAAQVLGMSRSTLRKKMSQHGLA